jgi:hypothetical protein
LYEECVLSIEDLQHVVEDMDGTKKKTKTKDKNTGVTFEKHGHFSDIFDYIVCYIFSEQFQDYLKGGKKEKRILTQLLTIQKDLIYVFSRKRLLNVDT